MIPTRARAYDTKPAPSGTISGRNLPTVGAAQKKTAPAGNRGLAHLSDSTGRGLLPW